jgi:hypothetical protein
MAMSSLFSEGIENAMVGFVRETMITDYCRLQTELFHTPSAETIRKAEEWADKLIADGKMMDYLEATMPKPCPTCGNVP